MGDVVDGSPIGDAVEAWTAAAHPVEVGVGENGSTADAVTINLGAGADVAAAPVVPAPGGEDAPVAADTVQDVADDQPIPEPETPAAVGQPAVEPAYPETIAAYPVDARDTDLEQIRDQFRADHPGEWTQIRVDVEPDDAGSWVATCHGRA